jgi:hypothetical protein
MEIDVSGGAVSTGNGVAPTEIVVVPDVVTVPETPTVPPTGSVVPDNTTLPSDEMPTLVVGGGVKTGIGVLTIVRLTGTVPVMPTVVVGGGVETEMRPAPSVGSGEGVGNNA